MRPSLALGALLLAATGCAAAGCGASSIGHSAPAADQIAAALSQDAAGATAAPTTSSTQGSPSQITLRIANLYETDTHRPGPGLDIYDVPLTGQPATPILTDVAYGSFSAYVHPNETMGMGSVIDLTALPTGDDPTTDSQDAQAFDELEDDGSHPQLTEMLTNGGDATGPRPLDSLSFDALVEKGKTGGDAPVAGENAAPLAPAPAAGDGELLADVSVLTGENLPDNGYYLRIDSSCAPPLNHTSDDVALPMIFAADTSAYATQYVLFPVTPGTHQISIVAGTGTAPPTCAQLTAKQGTTTVTVTAGQQSLVLAYGTSVTDLHLAVGPIQP